MKKNDEMENKWQDDRLKLTLSIIISYLRSLNTPLFFALMYAVHFIVHSYNLALNSQLFLKHLDKQKNITYMYLRSFYF